MSVPCRAVTQVLPQRLGREAEQQRGRPCVYTDSDEPQQTAMSARKPHGSRKVYSLPEDGPRPVKARTPHSGRRSEDTSKLIRAIDDGVIGRSATFLGPYGRRRVVYCDYTASGRSLQFIEDYILREVLPCYGNTHTTTSITSLQSTLFRHEARDLIRNACHASEQDAVIFAGSGCTGAVHKLLNALGMAGPPVVFMGPYEHHSTLLPWREAGATIVRIGETKEGFLDLQHLEQQLQAYQGPPSQGRQLIGCFSAASNITGILADDVATTLLLHQYGALAFWDYAAAAPYVKLDMNPIVPGVDETSVYKDAIFFSMHKFIGGVQTPGVLIAKKRLFSNSIPNGCGGGTVFFVTRDSHRYLQDTELREEGGTAAVVESIRAGLVMQLKETVGVPTIMAREHKIARMVLAHVRTIPELLLLGSPSQAVKRLPIFSFLVRHPRGTFLHHNFVCAVLNDVFGIQARGGCACAGPYAQDLLGIDDQLAEEYESVLLEDRQREHHMCPDRASNSPSRPLRVRPPPSVSAGASKQEGNPPSSRLDRHHLRRREEHSCYELLRPGFARVSLPYFMGDGELAFVLEALKMVATEGWKLLPQYVVNPETGEWRHHSNSVFRDRKWLGHIRYVDGKMTVNERRVSGQGTFPQDYGDCLQTARNIFNKARKTAQRCPLADQCQLFEERTEWLRWFMLPSEAQDLLLGNCHGVKTVVPFQPKEYGGARGGPRGGGPHSPGTSPASSPSSPASSSSPDASPDGQHAHRQSMSVPNVSSLYGVPGSESASNGSGRLPLRPLRPLHFAVGQEVNPATLLPSPSPSTCAHVYTSRARCYSLGSSAHVSPPILSPITMASLGIVMTPNGTSPASKRRSCSSQTDLQSLELELRPGGTKGTSQAASLGLLQVAGGASEGSMVAHSHSPKDLQAYVKGVTAELATEIKSEIREVISQVQDVLGPDFDEAPHCGTPSGPGSLPFLGSKVADLAGERTQSSECSSDETVIHVMVATAMDRGDGGPSHPHDNGDGSRSEDDEDDLDGTTPGPPHTAPARSAINSVSSQDSGINLTFHESDSSPGGSLAADGGPRTRRRKVNVSAAMAAASGGSEHAPHANGQVVEVAAEVPPTSGQVVEATAEDPLRSGQVVEVACVDPPTSGQVVEVASEAPLTSEQVMDVACKGPLTSGQVVEVSCEDPPTSGQVVEAAGKGSLTSGQGVKAAREGPPANAQGAEAAREGLMISGQGVEVARGLLIRGQGAEAAREEPLISGQEVVAARKGLQTSGHMIDRTKDDPQTTEQAMERARKTPPASGQARDGAAESPTIAGGAMEAMSKSSLTVAIAKEGAGKAPPTRGGAMDAEDACGSSTDTVHGGEGGGGGARWHCPPKAIWKPAVEALQEFDMVRPGDRVLVCLSGGKDSLSLLHTLHQFQFYGRAKGVSFTLGAATVDPGSPAYDPRPLIPYLASLGVPYLYEEQPILQQAAALDRCSSVCSFCSRMKRGRLYAAARAHGYNVLALGQHLDDLCESFLMSAFHNGRLRSMKAHYYIRERDLRVIRPFVYVREKALRQFAESRSLPVIPENCPACFEAPKERHRSKQLLAQQEILFPRLFWSLRSALHPLISFRHTGEESRAFLRLRKHSQSHSQSQSSSDTDEEPVV